MKEEILLQLILFIFGTIFGVLIKYIFEIYKISNEKLFLFKIEQYNEIIENMYYLIENKDFLGFRNKELGLTQLDYENLLHKKYFDCFTFAPKNIMSAFEKFLETPNHDNFLSFVINVRKDLWRIGGLKGIKLSRQAMNKIFKS